MRIAWSDVRLIAPKLAIDDPSQVDILEYVHSVPVERWLGGEESPRTRLARMYLAAHFATSNKIGNGGMLASESADGLSRTYFAPPVGWFLASTGFGRNFLAIIKASPARAGLVF